MVTFVPGGQDDWIPMIHRKTPFLGRAHEMAILDHRLELARQNEGGVVLLVGESGIGKTRLAQEFALRSADAGARCLWGRAWEIEVGAPAFHPWNEALEALTEETKEGVGDSLREQFVEFQRRPSPLTSGAPLEDEGSDETRFRIFRTVVDLLRIASAGAGSASPESLGQAAVEVSPIVLVLDDIHWADSASLLLLQYVARMCASIPLLLVVLYDDGASERSAHLHDAVASIEREPGAIRVTLHGLDVPDVKDLAASMIPVTGDRQLVSLATWVHRETDGNPLFAMETIQAWMADGLTEPAARAVPVTVRDLVTRRLARLSPATQEMLRTASILGRDFDPALLARIIEGDARTLDGALSEAERSGFISLVGPGERYRFSHSMTRRAVYAGLASRLRMRTHRTVAEILEARYGAEAEDHGAELAYHFNEVGDAERTLHYSRGAADRARAATAWDEAAEQYERVATLLQGRGDRHGEADALVALGSCWRRAGASRKAWQCFMRSLSLFEELGDGVGAARATVEALRIPTAPARREELARRGIRALGDADPRLEAQLHLSLALWSPDGDSESRSRARQLAEREDLVEVIAALEQADANQTLSEGHPADAREHLERLYAVCLARGKRGWALRFLTSASSIPLFQGNLDDGESALLRAIAFSDGTNPLWEGGLLTWLAGVALARDQRARYDELSERAGRLHPEGFRLSLLGALRSEFDGDIEQALKMLPLPDQTGSYPGWLAIVHGTKARVLHHAAQTEAALDELGRWAQSWSPFRVADGTPGYLHTVSCVDAVLAAVGPEDLVTRTYDELKRWSWARFAPGNACSLDRLRGDLARRLGRVDDAERHYREGADWALKQQCNTEFGRCLVGLAELAALRSDSPMAVEHLDRAIRYLRGGGATLYLRGALARREELAQAWTSEPEEESPKGASGGVDLSARELEVLRLIADGQTNRQIAERLTISTNTVARHVTHIFTKTSVSNRAEAVGYAHRAHLLDRGST